MESTGHKLIQDLKTHVLKVMAHLDECQPAGEGVSYRAVEELAGLGLELPAHNGWLTWSLLASLAQDGLTEAERRGRRLYWRLTATS